MSKPVDRLNAINLFKSGFNRKEISGQLKVTQKTVGLWIKEFEKDTNYTQEIKPAYERLRFQLIELIKQENVPINSIYELSKAIDLFRRNFIEL